MSKPAIGLVTGIFFFAVAIAGMLVSDEVTLIDATNIIAGQMWIIAGWLESK